METIAKTRRRKWLYIWVVIVVTAVLGLIYAGVSLFIADRLTRPTNHPLAIDPHRVSADAEAWSTRTSDGITLRGWFLPTRDRRHLIVLVHGMWSSWLEMAALGGICTTAASTSCCSISGDTGRAIHRGYISAVGSEPTFAQSCRGPKRRVSPTTASVGWDIRWAARRS